MLACVYVVVCVHADMCVWVGGEERCPQQAAFLGTPVGQPAVGRPDMFVLRQKRQFEEERLKMRAGSAQVTPFPSSSPLRCCTRRSKCSGSHQQDG